jgi:hypothetical protein
LQQLDRSRQASSSGAADGVSMAKGTLNATISTPARTADNIGMFALPQSIEDTGLGQRTN